MFCFSPIGEGEVFLLYIGPAPGTKIESIYLMVTLENVLIPLLQPVGNQYPRPWMTESDSPERCRVFIVGQNQARTFSIDDIDSFEGYRDALFNRNSRSCRDLYDQITKGKPSRTRLNLDRARDILASEHIHDVLETNIVCYSTPMSDELKLPKHRDGSKNGREIFDVLLKHVKPRVIWLHGEGTAKAFKRYFDPSIPDDLRDFPLIHNCREFDCRILRLPSLAPPAFNKWASKSEEVLRRAARLTRGYLGS